MTRFTTRCDATHHELSGLRGRVTNWLRSDETDPRLTARLVADVDVVTTELVANAIDHTDSTWVQVDVDVGTDVVIVGVANLGPVHSVPPAECWGFLEEGDRGRGLRIVRALSNHIEISGDDRRTSVRCEIVIS